jgi:hypothetical protein
MLANKRYVVKILVAIVIVGIGLLRFVEPAEEKYDKLNEEIMSLAAGMGLFFTKEK